MARSKRGKTSVYRVHACMGEAWVRAPNLRKGWRKCEAFSILQTIVCIVGIPTPINPASASAAAAPAPAPVEQQCSFIYYIIDRPAGFWHFQFRAKLQTQNANDGKNKHNFISHSIGSALIQAHCAKQKQRRKNKYKTNHCGIYLWIELNGVLRSFAAVAAVINGAIAYTGIRLCRRSQLQQPVHSHFVTNWLYHFLFLVSDLMNRCEYAVQAQQTRVDHSASSHFRDVHCVHRFPFLFNDAPTTIVLIVSAHFCLSELFAVWFAPRNGHMKSQRHQKIVVHLRNIQTNGQSECVRLDSFIFFHTFTVATCRYIRNALREIGVE